MIHFSFDGVEYSHRVKCKLTTNARNACGKIDNWCNEVLRHKWTYLWHEHFGVVCTEFTMYFEDGDDAMLFKLTWV